MSSLTDYAKNVLTRALCGRSPVLPTAVFLALGTGGSDPTGVSGEPIGNGYARQRVCFTGLGVMMRQAVATRSPGRRWPPPSLLTAPAR